MELEIASGIVRAAPAINEALESLTGCEGKTAVIFATCGAEAKDTLRHLERALTEKGVQVTGEVVLDRNDVLDKEKVDALIAAQKRIPEKRLKRHQ